MASFHNPEEDQAQKWPSAAHLKDGRPVTLEGGGYFPLWPIKYQLPDAEIRTFVTNFYRYSDQSDVDDNELWLSHFAEDAQVTIGNDTARGLPAIGELRSRMWDVVEKRRHTVHKVFPGKFQVDDHTCECMMFGDVALTNKDGQVHIVPWAAHATVTKVEVEVEDEDEDGYEWKFSQYRVWLQR